MNPKDVDAGDLSFAEQLILAEEFKQSDEVKIDKTESVFFIEMDEFTTRSRFTPTKSDTDQDEMPIRGEGMLETFLVVCETPNFGVTVHIDDKEVVDETYSRLSSLTNELAHVSAYNRTDKYVVNVSDYPFNDIVDVDIDPDGEATFDLVRVEGKLY